MLLIYRVTEDDVSGDEDDVFIDSDVGKWAADYIGEGSDGKPLHITDIADSYDRLMELLGAWRERWG